MKQNWESLDDLFSAISSEEYVVLRNYLHLREEISSSSHPDIDLLCRNPKRIREIWGLTGRSRIPDGIHYVLSFSSKNIPVDLRHVGDGYLDPSWENHILKHRKLFHSLCFVPGPEDYRYSLLYHVTIQKRKISLDYRENLAELFSELSSASTREEYLPLLELFLEAHHYRYTLPAYPLAVFHTEGINPKLLERRIGRQLLHFCAGGLSKVLKS